MRNFGATSGLSSESEYWEVSMLRVNFSGASFSETEAKNSTRESGRIFDVLNLFPRIRPKVRASQVQHPLCGLTFMGYLTKGRPAKKKTPTQIKTQFAQTISEQFVQTFRAKSRGSSQIKFHGIIHSGRIFKKYKTSQFLMTNR